MPRRSTQSTQRDAFSAISAVQRRVAIALVLALGSAIGAGAYVVFDDRWPDGAVTMHLQLGASGRLTDGSASWGDSAEAALADWNQHVSRVQFRVVRDSTAARVTATAST